MGRQESLRTQHKAVPPRLVNAKNEARMRPAINLPIASQPSPSALPSKSQRNLATAVAIAPGKKPRHATARISCRGERSWRWRSRAVWIWRRCNRAKSNELFAIPLRAGICDNELTVMNVTLPPGASLRRVAEIVRNAVLFGPDAWERGSLPERNVNPSPGQNVLPTDRDVAGLFTLFGERRIPYLLVGGIAMLRYVEGRNTEDIDLLMSLTSLRQLPEISIEEQNEHFSRGRFRSVRVDVLLTANALFAEAQQSFGAIHRFAELDVPTATAEGLVLLKLYALPSLYRRGLFDRVSVYESDIASLMQRHRPAVEPLLERLQSHLETGDMNELRGIVRDLEARIARFEQLKKL